MASHIVGYPRMGPKRELKFALESFWDGKSSAGDLQKVAADLRESIWKQMAGTGIKYIPSNTFSCYDQVLDTTAMLGAVPPRYGWNGGEIGSDVYFSMARGNASVPAMEMTKWFDTNYHFIVPELGPDVKFSYASHKAVTEYKEAKALGVDTVPVLVGPVSYLLLSKPAKGVEKSFSLLSLLGKILPIYKEVITELKEAGASWIQFDEPTLVMDLESHKLHAFTEAYSALESTLSGLNVLIETYFADIPAEQYKTLTSLKGVTAFGFDLVRGTKTLDLIKGDFPEGKYLFAGVVDGRNIWANDLAASLSTLETLEGIVGKDKLVVSTSCSLLHTAVDLVNETKLDKEIKSWLAFAAQKVVEVNALAKALAGQKDEEIFSANAAALASRKSSPRVTNEAVQKAAAALKGSDHRRATNVSARLDAQQKKLNLPVLPTTTIGSFPQTMELRKVRREYKAKKVSEDDYVKAIKEEIRKVVKLQEEFDIDVLVHGEPERNDMVEYFGEQLSGFAFSANGWVQSYGSRCVKPPIIYGDVSRPKSMTVFWSTLAQSMTARPMKGMLTGPVTILNWSFVRNDQPRFETCYQIALAIKDEVEDLEKNGITVIQIDEAALREGLPLRKSEQAFYLDWAVHSFRITNCGVHDTTQIHTHMCYSNFNDIIHSIIDMDADVITIENSRSDEKLLSVIPIQRLIPAQMKEKRDKGLCFKCDHKQGPGHRCGGPKLFLIQETKGDRDPINNTEDYAPKWYLPKELKEEIGISPPKTMRVKIMVNSHEYIALIDTGSNHNFLQPWVAREVGLKIIKHDCNEVRIADGSIMYSEGSCPEFKFVIQGCQFATPAYILRMYGCDVILGIQWLKGLGRPIDKWDFASLKMQLTHGGKTIQIKGVDTEESEEIFSANAAALASRKFSPRVTNEAAQKAAAALKGSDHRPMKGMLTCPVTILNRSFVRNDQPRFETCYQIALVIMDEVEDLEKNGIKVTHIDEAALREGLQGPCHRCGGPKLFLIQETKGDRDPIDNTEHYFPKKWYLPRELKEELGISPPAISRSPSPKTMRVKIMVNSHEYIALIDTGSHLNFLHPRVAQEAGLKIIEDYRIEVHLADGSIKYSGGSCPEFKFVIQGCQFATPAYIFHVYGCDVILGVQWLRGLERPPHEWDFISLTMEVTHGGKTFQIKGVDAEESEVFS